MAESTLNVTFDDLEAEVGMFVYGKRSSFSVAEAAIIAALIESGYSQFLDPPIVPGSQVKHEWNFLKPTTTFQFSAPYTTGTIAIASGVVTGTGTVFPSWAAAGMLTTGGVTYSVASRGGDTALTLDDLTVTVSSGATYTLYRAEYEMPDDYGYTIDPMHYDASANIGLPLREVGEGEIMHYRSRPTSVEYGRPTKYAIRPQTTSGTESSRWLLLPWPLADDDYLAYYRYRVIPDALTTGKYAYGGPMHRETLLESCLAIAERRMEEENGVHMDAFIRNLASSISYDNRTQPASLGYNGDPGMCPAPRLPRNRATSYNGTFYND